MNSYEGHIEVIYGPMFSGKSTELQRRINREKLAKRKVLLINYFNDNRYSKEDLVATHDLKFMKCTKVKNLFDINESKIDDSEIIGIDEGQFFSDLIGFAEFCANKGKKVIVACLNSTYLRTDFDFSKVTQLICIAEEITKLSAVCNCGNDAYFTQKINTNNNSVKHIGGSETYKSVCRKCYFLTNN